MTEVKIIVCGNCSRRIKIVRSYKPLPSYLQCPICGKNMMVDDFRVEDYEAVEVLEQEIEPIDLDEGTIDRMIDILGKGM